MLDGFCPSSKGSSTRGGFPFLALICLRFEDTQDKPMDSLDEDLVDRLLMGVVCDQLVCALKVPLLDP